MTGWHAKRFEFEPEWDNDAEAAIAEIEFKETDAPEEEAAKLQLLAIYNKRLDEVSSGTHGGHMIDFSLGVFQPHAAAPSLFCTAVSD
jgi:hypothetical protein